MLYDLKLYCLQVCLCIIQPGNFTGWGSEGVKGPRVHKYTGISVAQQNIFKCVLIHEYIYMYIHYQIIPLPAV